MISYRTKYDEAFHRSYDAFNPYYPAPDPIAGFTPEETRGTDIFNSNPGALCSSDSDNLSALFRDPQTDEPRRLNMSEEDKNALEAFLQTLTDHEFLNDPKFSDPFE